MEACVRFGELFDEEELDEGYCSVCYEAEDNEEVE